MDIFFKVILWALLVLTFLALADDVRCLPIFLFLVFILWLIDRIETESKASEEKRELESKIRKLEYEIEDLRGDIKYKLK